MWSMPHKVLQIVAGLLGACCVGGFVLGIVNTPERGRLPGEAVGGGEGSPMAATEARPLDDGELGPPKPPEPIAQVPDKGEEEEAPPPAPKIAPEKAPLAIPALNQAGPAPDAAPAAAAPTEDPPF